MSTIGHGECKVMVWQHDHNDPLRALAVSGDFIEGWLSDLGRDVSEWPITFEEEDCPPEYGIMVGTMELFEVEGPDPEGGDFYTEGLKWRRPSPEEMTAIMLGREVWR